MSFNGYFGFLEPLSRKIGFLEPFYFKNWLFGATFEGNWLFGTNFISKTGFLEPLSKEIGSLEPILVVNFRKGFTRTWALLERIGCLRVPVLVVNLMSYKSHPCFFIWLWPNDINKGFFGCEFLFLTCHFRGTFSEYPIK